MSGPVDVVERLESMLAAGKDSTLVRYGLGIEYLKRAEPARAAQHLAAAVALDPGYSAAWKHYGKALAESGDAAGAARAYESGIEAAEAKGDMQAVKEMRVFLRRMRRRLDEGD